MNIKSAAVYTGLFVLALGVIGLFMGEQRAWGIMNVNVALDAVRITLGIILLIGGLLSTWASRTAFAIFGASYLAAFVLGIASPTLFGLLPNGIGVLDQVLHVSGGLLGMAFAVKAPKVIASRM